MPFEEASYSLLSMPHLHPGIKVEASKMTELGIIHYLVHILVRTGPWSSGFRIRLTSQSSSLYFLISWIYAVMVKWMSRTHFPHLLILCVSSLLIIFVFLQEALKGYRRPDRSCDWRGKYTQNFIYIKTLFDFKLFFFGSLAFFASQVARLARLCYLLCPALENIPVGCTR